MQPHIYLLDCPNPRRAALFASLLSERFEALCLVVDAPVRAAAYLLLDEIQDPSHLIPDDLSVVPDYNFTIRHFCNEYRALLESLSPGGRLRACISEIEANRQWFDSFIIEDGAAFGKEFISKFGVESITRLFFHENRDPTPADAEAALSTLEAAP